MNEILKPLLSINLAERGHDMLEDNSIYYLLKIFLIDEFFYSFDNNDLS